VIPCAVRSSPLGWRRFRYRGRASVRGRRPAARGFLAL